MFQLLSIEDMIVLQPMQLYDVHQSLLSALKARYQSKVCFLSLIVLFIVIFV